MKKQITLAILISLLFTNISLADSLMYSKSVRGKIMDDFKEVQYKNIYEKDNVLLGEDLNFFETQNKIGIYENIRKNTLTQKQKLIIQKNVITNRVTNLEDTIKSIDEDISETQKEIVKLSREITELNVKITDTKNQIQQINKEIVQNKQVLLDYIAHIYKKSNLVYSSSGSEIDVDSLKTIILNSQDLGDVLSDLHFSSILEVTGQMLLEKHRNLVKDLFVKKFELENDSQKLKDSKKEELDKRKAQMQKKEFREKILAYTKGKEELFQKYVEDKKEVDKKIKMKILENQIKLKDQKEELLGKYNCKYINLENLTGTTTQENNNEENDTDCISLNRILKNEAELKPFADVDKNVLTWPVEPTMGLGAYFRDKEYENVVGTSHDAIDIIAPQGTDIVAPADGYITFLRAPTDQNYAYVVLKHANGFVTVYGHINEVLFKKYDFIKAGTVFAKSGGELGTNGAGVMTTGPHLHFEVFKDKEYVDPLNYLDLTQLGDKKVPKEQKYIYKFMNDYQEKYGSDYEGDLKASGKIFTLNGETEIDRQKDLLNKYATKEFNNWDVWVEEAIDGNIDPSFVMCIGLSETGLGRNLKTSYNVGNIGNTDSGETQDFGNVRNGIYRIVKTLNNKFLGKYNDMSKLSRYGNKDGSIYASSPINWHNNMVKCLSALKNKHIPDDYNFRITSIEE